MTVGRDPLVANLRQSLCANGSFRLRRAAVDGSVRVFPLRKGNTVYGAVMSREHELYVSEPDKPERLDGRALFTHLWLLRDGTWRMARILSYSHGPAQGDDAH